MKRNLFKTFMFFGLACLLVLAIVGCKKKKDPTQNETKEPTAVVTVNKPVFYGVDDVTIERGSRFLPLDGVTVRDVEDGDINLSLVTVDTRGFNANVVGEYKITYTVYDSDGNETKVERKVTVVFTDSVAPDIYGISDANIIVGDTSFTPKKDISVVDNIDGDITDKLQVTGDIDVWRLGDYELQYSVKDKAGNESKITRKVTVGIGNFEFVDFETYNNDGITGGTINTILGNYSLIKLNLKVNASSAKDYEITLDKATGPSKVALKAGENTLELYFRFTEPLSNSKIKLESGLELVSCEYAFAGVNDKEAPVITKAGNEVCVPVGSALDFVKSEILRGATAEDNLDGNVTSKLDVDLKDAKLDEAGTYDVVIFVEDTMENRGEFAISLIVAKVHDTYTMTDPGFDNGDNPQFKLSSGAGGSVTAKVEDGMYVVEIVTAGGWASGDSPYLSGITTDTLKAGYYYMAQFDVKAIKPRNMAIRSGMELWTDPWMENFRDTTKYPITTEWTTIQFIFYVSSNQSRDGSKVVKFEIQLGSIDWSSDESDNTVYIDNFQFYLLSNESNAPVITKASDIKTTFAIGEEAPDFTKYFIINDVEDGPIAVTADMIDSSSLDLTKAGTYTITITVIDNDGEVSTDSLEITVLESADTEGPVITIPQAALALIEASMPVKEGTDLTSVFNQVLENTTITDNIDGSITPTMDMVDLDGLVVNSVKVGEFNVSISCKDSSGNESNTVTIKVTVIDGTAPTLIGVANYTVYAGTTIDPTKRVVAYDTTDGIIHLTSENLGGFNAFMNEAGLVTGAAGEYQVSYTVKDAAGNQATLTAIITVEAEEKEFNYYDEIDLLAREQTVGGGGKVSIKYEDGVGIVTYEGPTLYWASASQLKYANSVPLKANQTYKLIIEAKADIPREILIYFVDGESNKIPGFVDENKGNKYCLGLTDEYVAYEIIFTPTSNSSSSSTLEFDMEWENYLANAGYANVMYFKQIRIVPEGENVAPPEKDYMELLVMDFQDLTPQTDFHDSKWSTQKLENDAWVDVTSTTMRVREKNGSTVVNMYSGSGVEYKYLFSQGGKIGTCTYFAIDLGNYFSPADTAFIKVVLVALDDLEIYVLGSADAFYELGVTSGLDTYELKFDEKELKGFYVIYKSNLSNGYIYMDNVTFGGPKGQAALDTVAPVITIDETVYQTVSTTKFTEGESLADTLTQLKNAVTITDDVDGTITLTDSMIDMGGLNVMNPQAGSYTLTITAKDAAGNETKSSIVVKVKSATVVDANLTIDFEEYTSDAGFFSPDWTIYKYTTTWLKVNEEQMRSRGKNGSRVVNMFSGSNVPYKYVYNDDGLSLGLANYFSIDLGNYFSGTVYDMKLVLVDVNGNEIYVLGDAENYYEFQISTALDKYELSFDAVEIASFYIILKAASNSYLYMDNITLLKK